MINVTLVTNDGSGLPRQLPIREGTTVRDLLNVAFEGDPEDFTIQLRPQDGVSQRAGLSDVLREGDRITLAPSKVEGA